MITIENKYNIGDTLWKIHNNVPNEYVIYLIEVSINNDNTRIYYKLESTDQTKDRDVVFFDYTEETLDTKYFKTKTDLIKSIM